MIKKYHVSKNLFNESAGVKGYYINASGQEVASSYSEYEFAHTQKIPVEPETSYTYSLTVQRLGMYRRIIGYNENENYIEQITEFNVSGSTGFKYITFTTPQNCHYITINYVDDTFASEADLNMMLNTGSTAETYEPYDTEVWHTVGYKKYETATDTFTTLPHEVIGDGQSNLTWSMDGNMQVNGTPTPQNPITPQETGEKTANLFDGTLIGGYFTAATFTTSGDEDVFKSIKVYLSAGTYTFSWGKNVNVVRLIIDGSYSVAGGTNISSYTITSTTDGYVGISFRDTTSGTTVWDNTTPIMLNSGSTAKTFEPYGYKIPISFGGVTYNSYHSEPIRKIGNVVDTSVSSGTDTYNIRKLVLTGQESWNISLGVFYLGTITDDYLRSSGNITYLSSHYNAYQQQSSAGSVPDKYFGFGDNSSVQRLYVHDSTYSTVQDFQAYLSAQYANGTPVTIWYILATPTTETFTAPSIPTSGTAQSFDVSTTLKPSEVSLTWHGWHEHEDTKFTT